MAQGAWGGEKYRIFPYIKAHGPDIQDGFSVRIQAHRLLTEDKNNVPFKFVDSYSYTHRESP